MWVKMKPVCDCGFVFDHIDIGYSIEEFYINSRMPCKNVCCDPRVCPQCKKEIEGIKYQTPISKSNRFEYDEQKYKEAEKYENK